MAERSALIDGRRCLHTELQRRTGESGLAEVADEEARKEVQKDLDRDQRQEMAIA